MVTHKTVNVLKPTLNPRGEGILINTTHNGRHSLKVTSCHGCFTMNMSFYFIFYFLFYFGIFTRKMHSYFPINDCLDDWKHEMPLCSQSACVACLQFSLNLMLMH